MRLGGSRFVRCRKLSQSCGAEGLRELGEKFLVGQRSAEGRVGVRKGLEWGRRRGLGLSLDILIRRE